MPTIATASASSRRSTQQAGLGRLGATACGPGAASHQIASYRVLHQIGQGGSAVVYKALDDHLQRTVAIKLGKNSSPETLGSFRQEAEIGGLLDHSAFPTLYDAGIFKGRPYLVQEYLPGEDLCHLIRRREPQVLVEKLDILVQVVRGLGHAHSLGITHGDVKPKNIRVLESGRVKILDFGAAMLDQVEASRSRQETLVCTPAYLAPERITGHPAGTLSDIFSFGVFAYELLAFQPPFEGPTTQATLDQILNSEPTPLTRISSECPAALAEVIHTCLNKNPAHRHGSFEILRDHLSRIQAQQIAALEARSKATPTAATQFSALVGRARQRSRCGMFHRARLLLREALALHPGHQQALQLLATVAQQHSGQQR